MISIRAKDGYIYQGMLIDKRGELAEMLVGSPGA